MTLTERARDLSQRFNLWDDSSMTVHRSSARAFEKWQCDVPSQSLFADPVELDNLLKIVMNGNTFLGPIRIAISLVL